MNAFSLKNTQNCVKIIRVQHSIGPQIVWPYLQDKGLSIIERSMYRFFFLMVRFKTKAESNSSKCVLPGMFRYIHKIELLELYAKIEIIKYKRKKTDA